MIRKAAVGDAKAIRDLINAGAEKGNMLPRALGEIYDGIREYHVYEEDGRVLGVSALHLGWEGLAELRSLSVSPGSGGRGIGKGLVEACLAEARELGVGEVFVLTYIGGFFERFGFRKTSREGLPQKIWTECRNKCVKYPESCNETAMILALG